MIDAFSPTLLLAISGSAFLQALIGIAGFLVAFGLAVFIHELGHFLAAKAFGVPVERFVVGMDKEAIAWLPRCIWERRIGETTYGLALMPLGGYVKMSGVVHPDIERYLDGGDSKPVPDAVPADSIRPDGVASGQQLPDPKSLEGQVMQDMAALYRKPFWQKAIIYSAGVIMNLVLAMVMVTILFVHGFEADAPLPAKISWIPPQSPWAGSALAAGDTVTAVDGASVKNADEMMSKVGAAIEKGQATIAFTLLRTADGSSYEVPVPASTFTDPEKGAAWSEVFLSRPAYIEAVIPNDPADKAGIRGGDLVTSIDGVPVVDWTHFRTLVSAAPGKEIELGIRREGSFLELTLVPTENPDRPGSGIIGAFPGNPDKELVQEPLLTALANSPMRVYDKTSLYVHNLAKLGGKVTDGNIGAVRREVGGPVGIAQLAYRQAQAGFASWVNFVILLNVALAVMNILPFPILDGGHICFALYEVAFGKPVPPRVLVPILNGAFVFIIGFFLLVTFSDLFKIFS